MESFNKQGAGALLQELAFEKLDSSSFFDEDDLPFEDFVDLVENKLAETEKKKNETNEEYLNRIQKERKFFLENLKNEKNKDVAKAMFDVMITFSHISSCDKCRTKYRKKRENP